MEIAVGSIINHPMASRHFRAVFINLQHSSKEAMLDHDHLHFIATKIQEDPKFWAAVLAAIVVPLFIVALLAAKTLIDSIDADERKAKEAATKKTQ
ncbi:hypothetical protein SPRG_08358 [Saprolegnia parasitica CBS 223.65]|uniref:Uncharacterized protein n=1 Tax=Saprolegnia parasitica (strain CBS 223.65) TaxID=695850 RepID=A0A067C719_SAPPC|nr:hypothetical protein SPRG_08358 [Saprolegnia parasitica CBS 223.65]KDO26283.1 hypothetical protein SPRG_08358 [Saprolegnia parasitica CBS 223.65]|eukprot:XP_012202988.1 hypothetical protein SPRG_08358 [Saprolegnia parasitica CBS 223.65]